LGKKEEKKMTILETKRLLIRPMSQADLYFVHDYLKDPETMKFFVEGPYTVEKVKEMINRNKKSPIRYIVLKKDTSEIIGHISLSPWFMRETYEIGFIFKREYHNQGYGTEAAQKMMEYAFETLKVHRVVATCQPENIASKKLIEKLKMKQEGYFKKCIYFKDGIWWDEYFYSLLEEDYFK
jgi:RimJ/RimL family protein N-acetyltransferase